ncbi:DNA-directed RNA polymerase, alpha subunit [Chloroherpeton thalassium ATCC 35110]|uniref:DNA-directed RNA polymerase subunit alpha n=1 Tax=Chloroherpeton thalassium (strain ATCC 35110 / GB-78) TaxID=517418 RepID=RPOA_CHLT3|nr:DNA-directed RNA polymerase subunit alpha [Chloroherpeton thalassium]B3QYF0.1 RecName: Full=DNA-directed RNA polymerase subunit alpha; Short=RNAP subunit alpha; AltName: Full=RNA polymerase subunit alpha; AltName: Full=Transcriptase subunit alpha [Chloroherpeton thalassium ATCC 35110]ACF13578.1 DNA-directed RNA polymerase, alpha subunit [Chloroherpeton thalassium ATCC 35110]
MIQQMQMPEKLEVDEASYSNYYGKFIAQPLERGYGVTIGNAIRRVLLSSLPGTAITGIKIEGVLHEFSTIDGVKEDVPDIVLNLKQIRFRSISKRNAVVTLVLRGPKDFVAGDIVSPEGDFEVLNPEHHIATLNEDATLKIDVSVGRGRGYMPAEDNKPETMPIGYISVDSIFTPIRNVKYSVENTRVGQRTDYEKLSLEVETDGSIAPDEAVSMAGKIINDHVRLFSLFSPTQEEEVEEEVQQEDEEFENMRKLLMTRIEDLELSVRSHNCLRSAEIDTLGQLVSKREDELLGYKNFGKKSLAELKELLESKNLSFGMEVTKYRLNQ